MRLKPKSLCIYLDRNGRFQVFDPRKLPASEAQVDLNDIAVAVINAGHQGIKIDESRLSNGKYVQAIAVRLDTYEGIIFNGLKAAFERKEPLPSPDAVLDLLKISCSWGDKS